MIRVWPRCRVLIAPFVVWGTENSASVESGVSATCSTIPSSSISQYGMKPYSSWPGAVTGVGATVSPGPGDATVPDPVGAGVTSGTAAQAARAITRAITPRPRIPRTARTRRACGPDRGSVK